MLNTSIFLFIDEIICPYWGSLIPSKEWKETEAVHAKDGQPPAIFKINKATCLDPYKINGKKVTTDKNPGTWLNHSSQNANAKAIMVTGQQGQLLGLVILAIKNIMTNEEVLHDYGDRHAGSPDWMFE